MTDDSLVTEVMSGQACTTWTQTCKVPRTIREHVPRCDRYIDLLASWMDAGALARLCAAVRDAAIPHKLLWQLVKSHTWINIGCFSNPRSMLSIYLRTRKAASKHQSDIFLGLSQSQQPLYPASSNLKEGCHSG